MLIIIVGQKGSGKTLRTVRDIIENSRNRTIYTNFKLSKIGEKKIFKKSGKLVRLKMEHLILKTEKNVQVNWEFWEEARKTNKISIFLDEFHNVLSSRNAMTKQNKAISDWLSQIRKVLTDSPTNHLYIITQRMRRVDVNVRELADLIIECKKIKYGTKVYINCKYYLSETDFELGSYKKNMFFLGNPYFNCYDTNQLITFGDFKGGFV